MRRRAYGRLSSGGSRNFRDGRCLGSEKEPYVNNRLGILAIIQSHFRRLIMNQTERVLDGIKVLDVATMIFGPAAATVMADFGADVIKIEFPRGGDPYRYMSRMPPMP